MSLIHKINRFLSKTVPWIAHKHTSYSQCGEDLIIKFLFKNYLNIEKPSYIDIGAHLPFRYSNTAIFYGSGSRGINIEPDPFLFGKIQKYRKKDINLNIGIADKQGVLDFYVINNRTLNTFSEKEAKSYEKQGYRIKEIKQIKVETLGYVIQRYSNNIFPDFLSVDAEGIDEMILKSIDYSLNYPKVICVETLDFSTQVHRTEICDLLESKGYIKYANTHINSIMVRKEFLSL
ncbi:MAG: FkbM family methyltransferase [Planctomycetes bacterium]|nr:FkbM family methyltransferase [Planctomycetota bacterium]MBU1518008.1 FkbM family methyltransferase [Planctomycetota bacterium]MBU2457827.1 FkbM family methyltransferase [Planctomycetota bacterium]MBU2596091.1 FkbM family methyltransferase [Planctomycetota bacterium]